MNKLYIKLLAIVFILLTHNNIKADGLTGAQITYKIIDSNSGRYRFRVEIYNTCESIQLIYMGQMLQIRTSLVSNAIPLNFISKTEITPIAYPPDVIAAIATNCPTGPKLTNGINGITKYIYEVDYTIGKNIGWAYVAWTSCCRFNDISTFGTNSDNLYIQAAFNTNYRNSSPDHSNPAMTYWFTGKQNYYNLKSIDNIDQKYLLINGAKVTRDSFAYELITPFTSEASSSAFALQLQNPQITYNTGFTATNFVSVNGNINLDQKTGIVSGTPSTQLIGSICYVVKEYRAIPNPSNTSYTREYIGHTMRETILEVKGNADPIVFNGIIKDSSIIDTVLNPNTAATCKIKNKLVFKVTGSLNQVLKIKDLSTIDASEIKNYKMSFVKSIAANIETMFVTLTYERVSTVSNNNFLFNVYSVTSNGLLNSNYFPITVVQHNGKFNLGIDTIYKCANAVLAQINIPFGGKLSWSPKSTIINAEPIDSSWVEVAPTASQWYRVNNFKSSQTCKFDDSVLVKVVSCDTVFGAMFTDGDKDCVYSPWEVTVKKEAFTVKGTTNSFQGSFKTDSLGFYSFVPPSNSSYVIESNGKMFNCTSDKSKFFFSLGSIKKRVDFPVKDSALISNFGSKQMDTAICNLDTAIIQISFLKTFGTLRAILYLGDGNTLTKIFPIDENLYTHIFKYKYLSNGSYPISIAFFDKSNKRIDSFILQKIHVENCLTGKVFVDVNKSCIFDTTIDYSVEYHPLIVYDMNTLQSKTIFTNYYGYYRTHINKLHVYELRNDYKLTCNSGNKFLTIPALNKDTNIQVQYPLDTFPINYKVHYGLEGKISNTTQLKIKLRYSGINTNTTVTKKYYLSIPNKKTYFDSVSSSNATATKTGNLIEVIQSSGKEAIVYLHFDSIVFYDTLCFQLRLTRTSLEMDTTDNLINFCLRSHTAYDPNAKYTAIKSMVSHEDFTEKSDEISYTINFQNLGNAPAKDIIVTDKLDSKLDLKTIHNFSSSHPMDFELTDNRDLIFKFRNINLPDSITDEPGSHGYINFKIKPLSSIAINDEIKNKAAIFFDFNPAVWTNEAISRYIVKSTVAISNTSKTQYNIYPNPASDFINIEHPNTKEYSVQLFSIDGRFIARFDSPKSIDIRSLTKGTYLVHITTDKDITIQKIQVQ